LISMPHVGTYLPPHIEAQMTADAQRVPDTDWHLERLYDFADSLGASVLVATHSRYVVDLNRPPDNENLYPGQDTTGLCPVDTFDKQPLYLHPSSQPDDQEIQHRREMLWRPYHEQLAAEMARLHATHGCAVLWDAHSIRSHVPRFFAGRLPDLNLGTANGASCAPGLANELLAIASAAPGHTAVLNGRFKGGYITRHYGNPAANIHAIQLEMAQSTYMDETFPFQYQEPLAAAIQPTLLQLLQAAIRYAQRGRR